MIKKVSALALSLLMAASILSGCSSQPAAQPNQSQSGTSQAAKQPAAVKTPKYIFMFIGDGMSFPQINTAQILSGNNTPGEIALKNLNFTKFPAVGVASTFDSTSFCPDSASTGTSLSSGIKTHSGVLGMAADKKTVVQNISEQLKSKGLKIGIISSVSMNHATPAAYYAHAASRNDYYDIAVQLSKTGFDYFAGGELLQPTGKDKDKPDAYGIIEAAGYKIARTKEAISALNALSGKTYAISPVIEDESAMPYSLDSKSGELTLADFVKKGTEVLDNDKGFFMMCESGKIDWACHANDAMSAITDVSNLDKAVQVAIDFAQKKPDETLIVVTGDHETGGMTIGYATTGYNTAFNILNNQKMSYVAFDKLIADMKTKNANLKFDDVMPIIKENFGLIAPKDEAAKDEKNKALVLTDADYKKLTAAFDETLKAKDKRTANDETKLLYGGYEPLSVTLTHIINNKAGIGWTSYSHTGIPVAVYAYGASSELFNGSYDNTDVYKKLAKVTGIQ